MLVAFQAVEPELDVGGCRVHLAGEIAHRLRGIDVLGTGRLLDGRAGRR